MQNTNNARKTALIKALKKLERSAEELQDIRQNLLDLKSSGSLAALNIYDVVLYDQAADDVARTAETLRRGADGMRQLVYWAE